MPIRINCKICGLLKEGSHSTYCRSCYNEYKRRHYARNREKEIARSSAYNKKNPDRVAENMRNCRRRNPEHFRAYGIAYRKKHKERYACHSANNNSRRRSVERAGKGITRDEWLALKERFNNCCIYCGKKSKKLSRDHFIPLAAGGKHEKENIVPACMDCNLRKNKHDPFKFAERNGRLLW